MKDCIIFCTTDVFAKKFCDSIIPKIIFASYIFMSMQKRENL